MVGKISVHKYENQGQTQVEDLVVLEEPLQIILIYALEGAWHETLLTLTMRTPGHDFELSLGLLLAEGIISGYTQIKRMWYCQQADRPENTVKVQLQPGIEINPEKIQRSFLSSSSCGVCGKQHMKVLETNLPYSLIINEVRTYSSIINSLNEVLSSHQLNFRYTGAIHAAALFDIQGQLEIIREDIGRHNAVDKVIGASLSAKNFPLSDSILFLSSRISFELVQKALMAGIPILAAVGAPSSLAISLAEQFGLSLIGFVRNNRFNVYTHPERVLLK
ncbi:MAG: formate dehydrogenase accessory sulfurtransferase FdhD [Bacteroidota bacterium]